MTKEGEKMQWASSWILIPLEASFRALRSFNSWENTMQSRTEEANDARRTRLIVYLVAPRGHEKSPPLRPPQSLNLIP